MWRHPKYYKELRKRNRDLSELQRVKPERSVPQSDQAISYDDSTESQGVRPGPGLKLQAREDSTANSTRGQVAEPQASSSKPQANQNQFRFRKRQAPSDKRPNPSSKRQASSRKLQAQRFLNHGTRKLKKFSWVKDRGPLP